MIELPRLAGYALRMLCWNAVLLIFIAAITTALAGDATIRGRLLDAADGAPVAAVGVKAYAPALGPNLWSAQGEIFSSFTDDQGRFAIHTPGSELQFWVIAEGSGGSAVQSVISGETGEFELRMNRELPAGTLAGRILDPDGSPASDLEIELVGEYSVRRKTRTDRNGSFQLTDLPSFGQGVLLASNKSAVLPQMLVRSTDKQPIELRLDQGATLSGTVIEKDSRLPVAEIKINIRPSFSSGYGLSTTSDSHGVWLLKEIPAGEYVVEIDGVDHFDPVSDDRMRTLRLGIGSRSSLSIALSCKAALTGEVRASDGKPIAGALVAIPTTREGTGETTWVRTTPDGRFTIHTGRLNARMQLSVFDPNWGLRLVWIEPLAAGESRPITVPPLRGSVRIRGAVVDEAGRGIDGIRLNPPAWISASMPVSSIAGGRFDLGRLPFSGTSEEFTLGLQAPRPGYAGMSRDGADRIWRTMPQAVEGRSFYVDSNMSFRAEHNQILDLKIAMKPAQLVVLSGRLAEENGQAPINGQTFLFRGTANESWAQRALPHLMGGGMIVFENDARLLGGVECGADGSFAICALRNDGEETPAGTRFSLGVASNGQPRHLLTQLFIPRDAKALPLEIIKLPAPKIPAAPAVPERPVPIPPIRVL